MFVRRLSGTTFGGLVLDYDRTICAAEERFQELSKPVARELGRLLRAGVLLGIATGRGKSAGDDLRQAVPKEYWPRVLVGYYNGAEIGELGGEHLPDKSAPVVPELAAVLSQLESGQLNGLAKVESRPRQLYS